jgi:hypothetical protein
MNEQKLLIEGFLYAEQAKFMRGGHGSGGIALAITHKYLKIKDILLENVDYFKNSIITVTSEDANEKNYGGIFITKAENRTPEKIFMTIKFHENEVVISKEKFGQIKIVETIKI